MPCQIRWNNFNWELGVSWSGSYGSWIYNYLCNQCLSPLTLWARTPFRGGVLDTLCDKAYQWLATGRWFSPVSSTNKTDRHDIAEILLKVTLITINLTPNITYDKFTYNFNLFNQLLNTFLVLFTLFISASNNKAEILMILFYFWCFNATFNNISARSWRPVLMVE